MLDPTLPKIHITGCLNTRFNISLFAAWTTRLLSFTPATSRLWLIDCFPFLCDLNAMGHLQLVLWMTGPLRIVTGCLSVAFSLHHLFVTGCLSIQLSPNISARSYAKNGAYAR